MRIVIAGASDVGRQLLGGLTQDRGHEIAVVDADAQRCEELAAEHDALVIHGDASNPEILEKAQISRADAVVACTNSDAINAVIAMLAHRQAVERIVVVVTTGALRGALHEIGVTDIVAPTMAAVAQIEAVLHGAEPTHLGALMQGDFHLAEMHVGAAGDRTRLDEHALPEGTLAVAHVRDEHMQLVGPTTELREGDMVLALAETQQAARSAHSALQ
jgi:trk system potassium uptake protein TrkA